jgi:DNA-binding MurR/RpiR family transcriptional regulator
VHAQGRIDTWNICCSAIKIWNQSINNGDTVVASNAKNLEALRGDIVRRYEELSPRLQQVARYVLENPNDMALQTLAVIAERCRVQPSTIVRFAKTFGYDGASEMQELFKDEMLNQAPSPSYAERIRQFNRRAGSAGALTPQELMQEFADSNILALEHLKTSVRKADLERAIDLIRAANAIYIVGLRRSFPVASYLAYALRHVDKRAYLLDGVAGMLAEQSTMLSSKDLLIAISFQPYAPETVEVVSATKERKSRIIAITDSRLSPIANPADIVFEIKDAEVRQFRSLTASLCLAQTLVISYAYAMEGGGRGR